MLSDPARSRCARVPRPTSQGTMTQHDRDDGVPPGDGPPPGRRRPSADNDHRWPHPFLYLVPVLLISALALAVNRIEPDAPDAFYEPPATLPVAPPGTILKSRPITGTPSGSRGWNVLYLSTGLDGKPRATSGSIFVPTTPAPPGGRNVVAWAHGTSGVAPRCAPSLRPGGNAASIPGFAQFIAAGYVVTATDYPGLGTASPHPYLVGRSEGVAVLDSVRAAGHLPEADATSTFAVWGHSQGGHAALFAGQQWGDYAPDLKLVGVAAAAPATELRELLEHDIGGVAGNVLAAMAVVSWSQVYAADGLTQSEMLHTAAIPSARLIADNCIETSQQLLVDLPSAEVLNVGFKGVDAKDHTWTPPASWEAPLRENTPSGPIPVPVLINQGTADTVVWPGITTNWVNSQCQAGMRLTEKLYDGRTHLDIATASAPDTDAWFAARFAGQPATSTCPPPATPLPGTAGASK